ncbi:MAG: arylsulfotransferase family protein [Thermoleophilaceae bacterium]
MPSHSRTVPLVAVALAIVLAVALGSGTSSGAESGGAVAMYPIGSTTTANPDTTISFRGATKLKDFSVTGSSTHHHSGTWREHPDGQGVSFIPDKSFKLGELVTVHTTTKVKRATKAHNIRFRIYRTPNPDDLRNAYGQFHKDPEGDPKESEHFRTRTDLRPPDLKVTTNKPNASSDPIFFAVKGGPGQDGPEIRDSQGRLLWFRRIRPPLSPYDFRMQTYQGRPVLTWWQGRVLGGKGQGYGVMLDSKYRLIKHVSAGNGYRMDQHEFEITPRGTAFVNIYHPVRFSLRPAGGSRNGTVWDSIVQEVDIKTGLVLFEWHSLAHVSVKLGTFPVREGSGFPYDPFHVNSVSEDGNGNLLLSARNTNALFLIDRKGGKVLSRIGGKKSDFEMGPGSRTIGQHQAVLQPDGTISIFDNGGSTRYPTTPDRPSRGVFIKVDGDARRVSLVHEYKHNMVPGQENAFSRSQGSTQVTGNDNVFISWGGGNPFLTEFTRDGDVTFESHISPTNDDTYRAYRLPWQNATGENKPDARAYTDGDGTDVYVSWNGATNVAEWVVQAGDDPDHLSKVTTSGWEDFETKIRLEGAPKYVRVKGLSTGGALLGDTVTEKVKHV